MKFTLIALLCAAATVPMAASAAEPSARPYKAPRAADGRADLQGIWNNSSMTPLERLVRYGDRLVMSPAEVAKTEGDEAAYLAKSVEPTDPSLHTNDLPDQCGRPADAGFNPGGANLTRAGCGYNGAIWLDPGDRVMRVRGEPRTSLITSTKDGRVPAAKPEAQARQQARRRVGFGPADNPENRSLGDRCITGFANTAGPVMTSAAYNNNYQIVQTKDHIALMTEMVHDTRIIRMNATHGSGAISPYYGESVGRWDGDTLVIETRNYHPNTNYRGADPAHLKVTERLTRTGPDTLHYAFTVEDPTTWDTPWSGESEFKRGEAIYEYACHEGNYGLKNILQGARDEEAIAARQAAASAPAAR